MTFSSRHIAIAAATVAIAAAGGSAAGSAGAAAHGPAGHPTSFPYPTVKYCRQLPVTGSPRWSFQGGHFTLGRRQAWALAHGALDERTRTASGYLCQHVRPRASEDRLVVMKAVGHYVFRSYAGHPKGDLSGDVLGLTFKVINAAYNPHCGDGAIAHVTLYGPDNGSRSNSVQINFPTSRTPPPAGPPNCTDEDRSYQTGNATVHIPALSAAPALAGPTS